MKIERPQAESRKIHSKDEFELCYLRHQYLRRVEYNPTAAEMEPYMKIVSIQAKKTFTTYLNLFKLVGLDYEDIVNIGRVHLVSFLGLFSLEKVPQKYEEFVANHLKKTNSEPTAEIIDNKNRANLTLFMKQRMEDVVRVCGQKARNIKGMATDEFYVFYGPKRPPRNVRKLLEDHEKYGFKKMDIASFKTIRKRVMRDKKAKRTKPIQPTKSHEILKFAGSYYISIPLEHRDLTMLDFAGANLDPYDNIHNKSPEELMLHSLDINEYERKKTNFLAQTDKRKENIVRNFIRKNKKNPLFKEEIVLARKFLQELRA